MIQHVADVPARETWRFDSGVIAGRCGLRYAAVASAVHIGSIDKMDCGGRFSFGAGSIPDRRRLLDDQKTQVKIRRSTGTGGRDDDRDHNSCFERLDRFLRCSHRVHFPGYNFLDPVLVTIQPVFVKIRLQKSGVMAKCDQHGRAFIVPSRLTKHQI